jgi:ParB/RepB/Spo0J family partition protein
MENTAQRFRVLKGGLISGDKMVDLDDIDRDDDTYRYRVTISVDDLVRSIDHHGQQVPIILRKRPGRSRYQLVCGFRRVTALRRLGRAHARAVVREGLTDSEAFVLSVLENEKRRSLRDIDRGWAIVKYRNHHPEASVADLEKVFGLQERQLQRLQRLTRFPQVIQEALASGVVHATHALVLIEGLGEDMCTKELQRWIGRVQQEDLSVARLRTLLRAGRTIRRSPKRRRLVEVVPAGRAGRVMRFHNLEFDPADLEPDTRAGLIRQLRMALRHLSEAEPLA